MRLNSVTYYGYIELCLSELCYAIPGINVTYDIDNDNISMSCSTPIPLDMEETLPVAQINGQLEWSKGRSKPCNDSTPLVYHFIKGDTHVTDYHIYGSLTWADVEYNYYFELSNYKTSGSATPSFADIACNTATILSPSGVEGKNGMFGISAEINATAPQKDRYDRMQCAVQSKNPLYVANQYSQNITVFASLNETDADGKKEEGTHEQKWQPILLLDIPVWHANYTDRRCFQVEQLLNDGLTHSSCICARRNVTEKYFKSLRRNESDDTGSETIPITTDMGPVTELSVTPKVKQATDAMMSLDLEDVYETISMISEMENISTELTMNVLSTVDRLLNGEPAMSPSNASSGDESQMSIVIPYETVCDGNENHEFLIIYYSFANKVLFVERNGEVLKDREDSCDRKERVQKSFPVLSGQLFDKPSMRMIHQIVVNGDYMPMAKIEFPMEIIESPLHGSLNLAYWNGTKWIEVKTSKATMHGNHYAYVVKHLTDFTLIVDGLEMDPILCDIVLNHISILLNFLSFTGLIVLLCSLTIQRFVRKPKAQRRLFTERRIKRLSKKYNASQPTYFVLLALFHMWFALFSDSRDLLWPLTCQSAAMILYWLLLTCILVTTFQSLNILKILANSSLLENLLKTVLARKIIGMVTFGVPTTVIVILRSTTPKFFDRRDYFCWIRPDYIVPAVTLPLGLLGLNSIAIFCMVAVRVLSEGKLFGANILFGHSSVRKIVSSGSIKTTSSSCSESTITSTNSHSKWMEKTFALLGMQLMLGVPWVCQYFTLFAPHLTLAHYTFTIVIGSQGIIFVLLFCYRKLKR
ncbi:MeTHuselah (aging-associated GPCR) like protein [Ditylenchus destructor]|nr:MeTHuselah (aging-associated GPCR) like protein [Ditylenchus destructor]